MIESQRRKETDSRREFVGAHPDLSAEELARLMKKEGLYSAKTATIDIRCSIRRFRVELTRRELAV